MNKKNITFIILASIVLALTYCKNIPDFPLQPVIKFNKMSLVNIGGVKGIKVDLDFTDGDGDLGLNPEDTNNEYSPQRDLLGIPTNDNFHNYFFTYYIQDTDSVFRPCDSIPECNEIVITSKYILAVIPNLTVDGVIISQKDTSVNEPLTQILKQDSKVTYPYLRPDSKKSPLSGTLSYDINVYPDYFKGKRIKLKNLYIKDRALRESNRIETDTLTIR